MEMMLEQKLDDFMEGERKWDIYGTDKAMDIWFRITGIAEGILTTSLDDTPTSKKSYVFAAGTTILDKSSTHAPALINPCLWLNFAYWTLMKWRINPAILGYIWWCILWYNYWGLPLNERSLFMWGNSPRRSAVNVSVIGTSCQPWENHHCW